MLKSLLKCVVCSNSIPNNCLAGFNCGQYLCCYRCITQLNKCPLCGNDVNCYKCKSKILRNALFYPGIKEFLDINFVSDLLTATDDLDLDGVQAVV